MCAVQGPMCGSACVQFSICTALALSSFIWTTTHHKLLGITRLRRHKEAQQNFLPQLCEKVGIRTLRRFRSPHIIKMIKPWSGGVPNPGKMTSWVIFFDLGRPGIAAKLDVWTDFLCNNFPLVWNRKSRTLATWSLELVKFQILGHKKPVVETLRFKGAQRCNQHRTSKQCGESVIAQPPFEI